MTYHQAGARPRAMVSVHGVLRLAITVTLLYAGVDWAVLAQSSTAPASTGAASASAKQPKFEVISIRRHSAESGPIETGPTPDGFRSIGLPMFAVVQLAYALPNQRGLLRGDQIEGTPAWMEEPYDVVAKVEQPGVADWQKPETRQTMLRAMLQAMLAERCKMVVHYRSKETPVYELVVAKGGPKFKRAETVDTAELRRKHPEGGIMRGSVTMAVDGPNRTQYYAISMSILANTMLSSLVDRPVVDKTGLTEYYDFVLPSSALRRSPSPPPLGASRPLDTASPPVDDQSIFDALGALGLRLEPAKGQMGTLVIDHAERPSEN